MKGAAKCLLRTNNKWALLTPFPLGFLVSLERRAKKPNGMESSSESACFHRLRDLFWTLDNPEVTALLSEDERATLAEFNRVFNSLQWRVTEAYPDISELPGDDLSPLVLPGEKLLRLLGTNERPVMRWPDRRVLPSTARQRQRPFDKLRVTPEALRMHRVSFHQLVAVDFANELALFRCDLRTGDNAPVMVILGVRLWLM